VIPTFAAYCLASLCCVFTALFKIFRSGTIFFDMTTFPQNIYNLHQPVRNIMNNMGSGDVDGAGDCRVSPYVL